MRRTGESEVPGSLLSLACVVNCRMEKCLLISYNDPREF